MHRHASEPSTYTAADYGHVLRRRWPWVLVTVLLGLGAGFVAMDRVPPTYVAAADVLVEPAGVSTTQISGGRTSGEINLDTEAQLVQSSEVAARAKDALGSTADTRDLIENLTITVPPNSQILSIAYEADDPAEAQAGAEAFAQAYLDNRGELARADVDSAVSALAEQRDAAAEDLREVGGELGELDADDPGRPYVENQQEILTEQVNELDARIQELSNANTQPGRVISEAVPPVEPAGFPSRLFLLGGAMLGLLVGLAAALMRERTDSRVRDAHEVESITGRPVVGTVPAPAGIGSRAERNAYARVRNILLSATADGTSMVAFTGVGRTAATGRLVTGLAEAVTSSGRTVLVVDTTPDQKPTEHGLSDLLRRAGKPEDEERGDGELGDGPPEEGRIGAGSDPVELPELLAGPQVAEVFAALRDRADLVLIVAPPAADAAAQSIATLVDAVVPIVTTGATRRTELEDAVDTFADVDATVLGVVLAGRGTSWTENGSRNGTWAGAPVHDMAAGDVSLSDHAPAATVDSSRDGHDSGKDGRDSSRDGQDSGRDSGQDGRATEPARRS